MEEILLLSNFYPIVDTWLSCKDMARQSCAMVPRWSSFGEFLGPAFPTSILRPLRLGEEKKTEEDRKKTQDENIMVCHIP